MNKKPLSFVLVFMLIISVIPPLSAYSQISSGSRGEGVKTMQKMLNTVMDAGIDVDGICGPKSVAAIKNFQAAYGLSVDGICGPKTWAKPEAAYNAKTKQPSTLSISSGRYNPGTLNEGSSYSINGVISSNYALISAVIGVHDVNGNLTSQVANITFPSNTFKYDIIVLTTKLNSANCHQTHIDLSFM